MSLMPAPARGSATRDIQNSGEMPYRDAGGIGAFRTVCSFSHMNFDDPLVFPGQQNATHLHMYFGNTSINFGSNPAQVSQIGNGTCRGGIVNRSAYWVPAMIDTRNGRPLVPSNIDVYYKTGYFGVRDGDVRPWPAGFRMISGNSKSTAAQQDVVWYQCNGGARQNFIPSCSGTMTMVVRFQQCWDGRNIASPDHQSHVRHALPGAGCPSGYTPTPELSINVHYSTNFGDSSTWRLSSDLSGAPPGSSGHADWIHGWEQDVMNSFVTRVINPGLSGGSHIVGDGRVIF
jgi:hypothetical protein